ncbi:hypothetical protein [Campylobacter hyointestinalis]|uniref:hypothetical protein n=1 Tax=Campylobacter hyointestinalis TaxID=198 RepID=UPI001C9BE8C6|nr:hypothetical protein [Campylobacter hyointestinalis]
MRFQSAKLWSQRPVLPVCEVKMGYPACGALGGSRECNSLSQSWALLSCEVKSR